jgi:hypothetical protein
MSDDQFERRLGLIAANTHLQAHLISVIHLIEEHTRRFAPDKEAQLRELARLDQIVERRTRAYPVEAKFLGEVRHLIASDQLRLTDNPASLV